jgi:preprotein translocase subunit SecE
MKGNILSRFLSFFKEVKTEMKRVNWPTRKETIRYTLIVVGISIAVAIFLGGLDFIFRFLLEKFVL